MMHIDFNHMTCVVTGAASGMGRQLALKYAEAGANLVLLDYNEALLAQTADLIAQSGSHVLPCKTDVSSSAQLEAAFAQAEAAFGAIHVLANCAGISTSRLILDVPEAEWDRVININLKSVFLASQLAAKNMIAHKVPHGKILTISSISSKIGEVGNGVYSVSKAGINCLTQVLAQELGPYGISVSAVCPGYVNTELMMQAIRTRGPLEGMTPEAYEQSLLRQVPLGRMVEPEEIADFMLFLSSPYADYITGVSLTMAGGRMLL